MSVYAITYDLHDPGQKYEDVAETIKSLGSWWKHFDSFWLLKTNASASDIRDELKNVVDSNDKVFVIEVKKHWAALKVKESGIDWLKNQL